MKSWKTLAKNRKQFPLWMQIENAQRLCIPSGRSEQALEGTSAIMYSDILPTSVASHVLFDNLGYYVPRSVPICTDYNWGRGLRLRL